MKKQVCSMRLEGEILSKIDRIACEEDRTRGAVIRRIIRQFFEGGKNESENHRENDRPGKDVGIGGGHGRDTP